MDIVLLYANNWSTHSIDAENDLKGNTLGTIRFFRTYFNVNIPRYSDTFLSEPHPQSLKRHYFRYCSSARI